MPKTALKDLLEAARSEIRRRTELVYDVAADVGQIVDNVAHMRWFIIAVANALIAERAKYGHLEEIPCR